MGRFRLDYRRFVKVDRDIDRRTFRKQLADWIFRHNSVSIIERQLKTGVYVNAMTRSSQTAASTSGKRIVFVAKLTPLPKCHALPWVLAARFLLRRTRNTSRVITGDRKIITTPNATASG